MTVIPKPLRPAQLGGDLLHRILLLQSISPTRSSGRTSPTSAAAIRSYVADVVQRRDRRGR